MTDDKNDISGFLKIINDFNHTHRNVVFLPPTPEEMRKQLVEEVAAYLESLMLDGNSFNDAVNEIRRTFSPKDLNQRWEVE